MRITRNVVHIRSLPRCMLHVPPTRQNPRTRLRRRTRNNFAIRRHMPPYLGKQPLDTEMRLQPLPLMVDDFHYVKDERLQTKRPKDWRHEASYERLAYASLRTARIKPCRQAKVSLARAST